MSVGLLAAAWVPGCGITGNPTSGLLAFAGTGCDGASAKEINAADLVILDWTGGVNQIYPGRELAGVDLARFPTADGSSLGDHEDQFKKDVLDAISRIYCAKPEVSLRVINGEDSDGNPGVTIVHITQERPPNRGTDVGEGEYDPCNLQTDNAAILYGDRLLSLSDAYPYDEWVNMFANICAHEIGHTLGFGHVARSEYSNTGRSIYVELMLDGLTMPELRREHRFLVDLSSCPSRQANAGKIVASGVREAPSP
ncbi:MAG: hypothetical protein ACE5E5_12970 [Phycisphaerae bacterium]